MNGEPAIRMEAAEYRLSVPLPRGLTADAMPNDFGAPADEAAACRQTAALFDYSFLLRLRIEGARALEAVSVLCGRDFSTLPVGSIRYALHADAGGWLVSDLTVWRTSAKTFEIMSGRAADVPEFIAALAPYDVKTFDLSDQTAVFAVQGPQTTTVLAAVADAGGIGGIPFFGFRDMHLFGAVCRVGRLGFTGLDGVEILCAPEDAPRLWHLLTAQVRPAGFAAADQLRLSAGLALFSNEFRPPVSAADIGLRRVRPDGTHTADKAPARVSRVCFRAQSGHQNNSAPEALAGIEWTPDMAFPPVLGALAVTSLAREPLSDAVIGMGYVARAQNGGTVTEPSGILTDVRITRKFPDPP